MNQMDLKRIFPDIYPKLRNKGTFTGRLNVKGSQLFDNNSPFFTAWITKNRNELLIFPLYDLKFILTWYCRVGSPPHIVDLFPGLEAEII